MTRLMRSLAGQIRPAALFIVVAFCQFGMALAGRPDDGPRLAIAGVVVALLLAHAVAVNDLADEAVDRANGLDRPLVSGGLGRSALGWIAGSTAIAAAAVSLLLPGPTLALVLGGVAFGIAYSLPPLRLSGRGAAGLALLPVGYVALPFGIGFVAGGGSWGARESVVLAGCALGFIGRIVLKDFRDVAGDQLHGKRTFLVRHGPAATCTLAGVCWLAGAPAVVALPDVRPSLVVAHAVLTAVVLAFLALLRSASSARSQARLINGVAIIGRVIVITAIAHLSLSDDHLTGARYDLAMAVLTLWAVITAVEAVRLGPVHGGEPSESPAWSPGSESAGSLDGHRRRPQLSPVPRRSGAARGR